MGEVDPDFIQALEHRPKTRTIETENIPLIDLSPLKSSSDVNALASLVSEIGDACENWGFFQVINHGVPLEPREMIESASRKFFALPREEKKKVSRDEVNPYGYYDTEHTKNIRDWKEIFDFTAQTPTILPVSHEPDDKRLVELINQWPKDPPELREACEEHAKAMEKLAFKLLELIALSLGLKTDRLHGFFKDQTSRIRLNYYPPCPVPHLTLGVGRHKDSGALTVLAQDDVGGLQVRRKSDGEWIFVKPIQNSYIINIGDIIQVWSNDKYESVEHRAMVNSEKARFSIPYFLNPAHYTWVEPLEELTSDQNQPKYKGYSWGKYRTTRNRGLGSTWIPVRLGHGATECLTDCPKLRPQMWCVIVLSLAKSSGVGILYIHLVPRTWSPDSGTRRAWSALCTVAFIVKSTLSEMSHLFSMM